MGDQTQDDFFSIAKVQLHSGLRTLNAQSFYRIDRFDGRRWLSTSLSLEQCHRDETNSNMNKTAIDILWLCIVLVVYRTANKNLFI